MHGVSRGEEVLDDDADAGVGAKVVDVPFLVEGEVALVNLLQDGDVVVGAESLVVHVPEIESSRILLESNVDLLNGGRRCRRSLGLERDGERQVIIPTGGCVVWEGVLDSCWSRGLVGLGIVDWCQSFLDGTAK